MAATTIVKLKAGESALVAAVNPDLVVGGGPMPGGKPPVDPGYGIDLGLGYLRPTHPIAPGGTPPPVDPGYGVDENTGWVHPDNTLPVPPEPVDPAYGIDEILGILRPGGGPIIPPTDPSPPGGVAWEVKTAWTPVTGWIVVAVPTGEHAAPSKKK
jgi:hypothetical protein